MCWEGKPASYTERAQSIAAGLAEYKLPLQTAFIFSQELQRAAMSHSSGKTLARKKATSCYIHPLAKVEKLSNGKQLPLEVGDLLQSKGCAHFSSFFSAIEKMPEGKWQPRAPCFIVCRQRGFSSKSFLWFIKKILKSHNNLGILAHAKWLEREGTFPTQRTKLVCLLKPKASSERNWKAFELGIKRVWSGLICSNSRDSCTHNLPSSCFEALTWLRIKAQAQAKVTMHNHLLCVIWALAIVHVGTLSLEQRHKA